MQSLLASRVLGVSFFPGCARSNLGVFLAGDDGVTLPGKAVPLRAKLEQQNLLFKDIENAPISFTLMAEPATTTRTWSDHVSTNGNGRAETMFQVAGEGLYEIEVSYDGNSRFQTETDRIVILAISGDKPVLVLDVDETLTRENWTKREIELLPFDGETAAVVNELAERYAVIYLSARPKFLHRTTREWLRKHRFPEGPILLWHPDHIKWLSFEEYKEDVLLKLRQMGIRLAVGVGNTEGDIEAYREVGMKAIRLKKPSQRHTREDAGEIAAASNWSQIRDLLQQETENFATNAASRPSAATKIEH